MLQGPVATKQHGILLYRPWNLSLKLQVARVTTGSGECKPKAVIPETTLKTQTHLPTVRNLQQRLNAPLQLPLTLFKWHVPEHLFISSRENLPQHPLRSLALLLMSSTDLHLQELYIQCVRLSLLRLKV